MKGNEMNDTKEYTDGTVVTGTPPFPAMSPKQQDKHDALSCLNDIESLLGGKNGPSIRLRSFIEAEAVQDEPHRSFFNEIVEGKPYEISNDIGALRREVVSLRALLNYEYKKQPTRKEAVQVEPVLLPLKTNDVVKAILSVGTEAARRGKMFPQTSDEQHKDRQAEARVIENLAWYEKNTGCANIDGWPITATPQKAVQVEPAGWMTHHDEPMLFATEIEAAEYCEDDERPIPLYTASKAKS